MPRRFPAPAPLLFAVAAAAMFGGLSRGGSADPLAADSLAGNPLAATSLAADPLAGDPLTGDSLEVARVDPAHLDPGRQPDPDPDLPAEPDGAQETAGTPDLGAVLERLPPSVAGEPSTGPGELAVEYTPDPALDAEVREILERGRIALGQVIAMDASSGEVLSWVDTDPATFPATRTYPTASLMKVVTAAAALRATPEATTRTCRYAGSPYQVKAKQLVAPKSGGQLATFEDALAISNNQCFARLAVHDLGRDTLIEEIERVGMLAPPAPGLPAGTLAPVEDDLALGHLGSGLAGSTLSPLAAVRLAAALDRGNLVAPRWVARVRDAEGRVLAVPPRPEAQSIWPRELADSLRAYLLGVTERGTARRAFHDEQGEPLLHGIDVAGKTGTLLGDAPYGLYQWFIGVAPADSPQVAIAALVVHDPQERREITSAAKVAAQTLHALFCEGDACRGERLARLRTRAEARDIETESLLVAQQIELARARAAAEEVRPPRLVEATDLEFPHRLRRRRAEGEIVLLVSIAPSGDVSDVAVDSSELPRFDEFVSQQVRSWKFAPQTRGGEPEASEVRLRIPIRVN